MTNHIINDFLTGLQRPSRARPCVETQADPHQPGRMVYRITAQGGAAARIAIRDEISRLMVMSDGCGYSRFTHPMPDQDGWYVALGEVVSLDPVRVPE
jgi:hypothetical protein